MVAPLYLAHKRSDCRTKSQISILDYYYFKRDASAQEALR